VCALVSLAVGICCDDPRLRWKDRWLPQLECGGLADYDPPDRYRVHRWLALASMIGENLFIRIHTHGTREANAQLLLGGGLNALSDGRQGECSARGRKLHWATARDLCNAVSSAVDARRGAI
jgi:hypothetical protein